MKLGCKKISIVLSIYLVFSLPLPLLAAITGEIIYRHPLNHNELWIGNINDARSGRLIFKLPHIVRRFSIQKDGRYIVTVVEITDNTHEFASFHDVYLLDRKNPNTAPKRLTQGQYREIIDAAISPNKDVVFTNHSFEKRPGVYLIPSHEIEKKNPEAKLIQQQNAYHVDWLTHRNEIVYNTDTSVFQYNILTKQITLIAKDGNFPVSTPNSKRIAFLTKTKPYNIGIVSVVGHRNLHYIEELEKGLGISHLTWSSDGSYLVYTLFRHDPAYTNFAIHLDSGRTERILNTYSNGGLYLFEWASRRYSVEPTDKLTTVWGKIKRKND
ncbi:hypothetical protein JT359_14095 [Candidatus Poribacteria bacterium]|nr:hypothetical protein [Candidatus Poribacteria bacterium]